MQSWGGLSDWDRQRQGGAEMRGCGGAQRGVFTSLSRHPGLIPSTGKGKTVVASGVQGTLDTIWFKPAWNTL